MNNPISSHLQIQSIRETIDTIDSQLIALLLDRFNQSKNIAMVKEKLQMQTLDSNRENEIRKQWIQQSSEEIDLIPILDSILSVSKSIQRKLRSSQVREEI